MRLFLSTDPDREDSAHWAKDRLYQTIFILNLLLLILSSNTHPLPLT